MLLQGKLHADTMAAIKAQLHQPEGDGEQLLGSQQQKGPAESAEWSILTHLLSSGVTEGRPPLSSLHPQPARSGQVCLHGVLWISAAHPHGNQQ